LEYWGQSGALNESMSDVFGALVKQRKQHQKADEADWLIGAELLGPEVSGEALRSMAAPGTAYDDDILGKDPQPAHIKDYVNTTQDNGGVHINSGIPNHAFYLAATTLGGYAWERTGRIWYESLRDPLLRPTETFQRFANFTLQTAQRLYGPTSQDVQAVQTGWDKVGVAV
ncbi:MAG: M4 family metallopeptidase, partial [Actinomycetota bacterium]|nr:M4 family metallopeptidase [Actinomycetota bacterium]